MAQMPDGPPAELDALPARPLATAEVRAVDERSSRVDLHVGSTSRRVEGDLVTVLLVDDLATDVLYVVGYAPDERRWRVIDMLDATEVTEPDLYAAIIPWDRRYAGRRLVD